jgi:VCBS repeat-containing protein
VTTQLPDKEAVVSEALLAALNLSDGSGGTLGADAGALRISGDGVDSAANNGDVTWDFVLDNALVQYLAEGEVVTAVYRLQVNDGDTTTNQDVTVTLTGVNDASAFSLVDEDSVTADLTETDLEQTTSGTVTVGDVDFTDTVTASITGLSTEGPTHGVDHATLLAMLSINPVSPATLIATDANSASLSWAFDSDGNTFDGLVAGQTLELTYTITVTDNLGTTTTQDVVITLTGSNDVPVLAIAAPGAVAEAADASAQDLELTGNLSIADKDIGDTLTASKADGVVAWSGGELPGGVDLTALIELTALTFGDDVVSNGGTVTIGWTYDPAAVDLDFLAVGETLTVTWPVTVADGQGGSDVENLVITITGSSDAPAIAVGAGNSDAVAIPETDAGLTGSGTLGVVDLDYTNTVSGAVVSVGKSGATGGITSDDAALLGYLSVTEAVIGNAATTGTLAWSFDSNAEAFDYLAHGESLVLAYTVQVTDNSTTPVSDTHVVTVTISGSNDAPVISVDTGDKASDSLTESGSALTSSGTLSVADVDYSNTVGATVHAVQATGTTTGLGSDNDALLAMLSLAGSDSETGIAPVIANNATTGTIAWSFDSASEVFAHLGGGETLTLTYTIRVTDAGTHDPAVTDDQTVTFTISGSNNAPVITATDLAGAVVEDTTSGEPLMLRDNGSISFSDADTSDTSTVTRTFVSASVTTQLPDKETVVREALLAALNLSDGLGGTLGADAGALRISGAGVGSAANNGDVTWDFVLDNALVQYLAAGEVVTAVYRLQVNDGGTTTTEDVTVTVTGVNDAPDLTPGVVSAALSEGRDLDAGNLVASGIIDFVDTDATDRVQASVAVKSVTLGSAATPSEALNTALTGALTLSGDGEGAGANSGTTDWAFALDNDLVRALPVGEVLTAVYTLTFTDDAAGTTTQDVTIEIRPRVATQLVVTEIPQQAAGVGFAVEVTLADELGAPILNTGAAADITLSLKAGNGTLGGTSVGTLAVGESSLTLSGVTYTLAEEDVQLTATATGDGARADGLTGDSNPFDVIAGPAVRVALTGPVSVVAGVASGAITATTYDQHDNVAPVSAETVFSLASDEQAGTAAFAPASGVFNIAAGASAATFTYTNTKVGTGTHILTASRTSGDAVGSDTHNIAVIPAAAVRVAVTGPESTVAGEASEAITLTTYDSFDNVAPVTADTTFSLASSQEVATATFVPVSGALQIDAGNSSASFTYTNTQVGTGAHTLTVARATGNEVGDDTHAIAIVPAAAVSVSLTGPASVVAGVTSGAFTATTYDTYGNVAPVSAETVFSLSSAEQGATAVFDPASETFAIAADASSATFTYSNQKVGSGSHTITAARSSGNDVGSDDHVIAVNPSVPAKIALTGPADIIAGITTATMTVTTLDTYDNPSPVSQNTTFTLSTDQAAASASFDPASGDFTVAGGSSSAQFVYGNTMVGSGLHRLTATRASGDEVGSDNYDLTVFSGVPTKLVFVTQPAEISTAGVAFPQQPVVRFEDDYGNVIINADVPITLTLSTGTGTLSGTVSVDAVSGVAIFDGLSIDLAGSDKVLTASATFITEESEEIYLEQASDTFRIRPSELKRIVILTQPQETVAGTMVVGHPTVQLQDEFENPLEVPHSVTIELIGAELHPDSVITVNSDVQGIAVFDQLRIDHAGTDYTIRFTASPIVD